MTSYKDVFGRYADRPQVVHVTIKEVEMEPKVVYVTVEKVDRLHNEWRAHSVYTEPKTSGGDA